MIMFGNIIRLLVTLVLFLKPGHTFFDTFMYPCSSAMVCVDIAKCDKIGVMSKNDVILSEMEELFRQPLVPCRKSDGEQGVCCRDPDYKDDWPTDVKEYDKKGQWNPKPSPPKILGSDTKKTEVRECNPPAVKQPNGKCGPLKGSKFDAEVIEKPVVPYLPPKLDSKVKPSHECGPDQVRLPSGGCGVIPCPHGTKKGPDGKCQPKLKVVPTTKTTQTKTTLPYMPDRTYLPPKIGPQVKNDHAHPPISMSKPVWSTGVSLNKCPYGLVIEQNNKLYCCEEIS